MTITAMKDYFKPKTWLIAILMFVVALGLSSALVYYEFGLEKNIKITRASANDNVSGWAWNANTGWISFNCTSDPDCDTYDYGVKIDLATGYFSGYAWSANVGWISFNRSDAGDPPANPYKNGSGNDPIARYNSSTGEVDGWAKIRSLNGSCIGGTNAGAPCPAGNECIGGGSCQNNGWIKLRKSIGSEPDYGVSINPATGNFSGWAWNANTDTSGIGWISFNCDHTNDGTLPPNNIDTCGTSNYKVVGNINRPPTITNMTAPNWSFQQAGESGALNAYLGWTFSDQDTGSSESAYQIIVNTQNNRNNPFFDTGKCVAFTPGGRCTVAPGASDQFPLQLALANISSTLDYGESYYWWIQIWDNYDVASGWLQYNSSQDTPYPEADDGAPLTFTTYKHEFPRPIATPFPANPSRGEEVKLMGAGSRRFFSGAPDTPVDCQDDTCDWLWTASNAVIADTTASSTTIIFNNAGANTVTLRVTDQGDTGATPYYSTISIPVNVNAKLPKWKEVKPE